MIEGDVNMNQKMTLEFDEKDIIDIVKEYVKNQGYNVQSVKIDVQLESRGHGMSEYDEAVFNGVKVKCTKNDISAK